MRSLNCNINKKAKNSNDCYNCFQQRQPSASRVLCVKTNAKYFDESQDVSQAPVKEEEPVVVTPLKKSRGRSKTK